MNEGSGLTVEDNKIHFEDLCLISQLFSSELLSLKLTVRDDYDA